MKMCGKIILSLSLNRLSIYPSDFNLHPSRRPAIYSRGPGNIARAAYYLRSLDPADEPRDDEKRRNMKQTIRLLILILSMCFTPAHALTEVYEFETPIQAENFYSMVKQLRCMVCQNQSVAESDAPLAEDMRTLVYTQLKMGQTPEAVLAYLKTRYGDYIEYKPPFNLETLVLWGLPFSLLGIVIFLLWGVRGLRE